MLELRARQRIPVFSLLEQSGQKAGRTAPGTFGQFGDRGDLWLPVSGLIHGFQQVSS